MNTQERIDIETARILRGVGQAARQAARVLAIAPSDQKNAALQAAAVALRKNTTAILAANAHDVDAARAAGRPASFVDRLLLNATRIEAIANGLEDIAGLADPVGTILAEWTRPNGLRFQRIRVPG